MGALRDEEKVHIARIGRESHGIFQKIHPPPRKTCGPPIACDQCAVETKIKEIEIEVMPARVPLSREQEFTRLLAYILDDLIPIPGTKHRIGLDPIIGLIPGIGDTSTTALSSVILIRAFRAGVPKVVLIRMAANLLINSLFGAIPGLGDLFSAWFKSNQRNYHLLTKHENRNHVSTVGDWTFLIILLAVLLGLVLVIALAAGYLAFRMLTLIFGG